VLFSYVDFDFILDPRFVSIGFWSYRFVSLFSAHIFCGQEFRFPIFQPGCPLESSPTSRRLPSVSEFCFSGGLSSQLRSWIRLPCGFLNSSGHCSALCPQLSVRTPAPISSSPMARLARIFFWVFLPCVRFLPESSPRIRCSFSLLFRAGRIFFVLPSSLRSRRIAVFLY
jgi:hypothetical protein